MSPFDLEHSLKAAIQKKEFSLFYQPIIELKTRKMVSMEALIRWKHPHIGFIPPDVFVPFAEKNNLINPIGNWVLESVCLQIKEWISQGFNNFKVSANVSPNQLLQKNFSKDIADLLQLHRIPSHFIALELTETISMPQATLSEKVLLNIEKLGIDIIMDDFGTGFSSLSHLKQLPVHSIKIDRSFIHDLQIGYKNAVIVSTLITLGTRLGLYVVAEGVETEDQIKFLMENGCALGQGNYLATSLNSKAMTALLNDLHLPSQRKT